MNDNREHENGYCVVCGSHSSFRFDSTIITPQLQKAWGISNNVVNAFNRKESMFCSSCGASLRIRRLAAVLMQTFEEISGISCKSVVELRWNAEFRQLKIAEINACGALHSYLKDHPNLSYSEWLSDVTPGEMHDGVRCEDLQCLTYPDNYFDIILTSETLEHVPDPDRAWREINRTLKCGGYHVFTIPVIPSQRQTIQRAQLVEGVRKDLLEPAYHGPPERQNIIVYTDFGMDVTDKLNNFGLRTEIFCLNPETDLDVAVVFRSQKTEKPITDVAKKVFPRLEWTGERYVPWLEEAAIGYEHLHRYAYTTQFVRDKRVLDLACGEGYGSYLLARTAESVVGIDIDETAIKHARNKYIKQNLDFKVGSITEVPIAGKHLFDVAVCFEALEHIEEHQKLLSEAKRLLTPDGIFIVSTPNKRVYSDEPQFNNPFHVHELYFDEFRELFENNFKNVKFLGQRIYCNSNIWPVFSCADSKVVEYVIDRNPREFVFVENEKRIPLYFIAIVSDADCDIEETGSTLIDVSDALLKQKDGQIAAHTREQERLTREIGQLSATVQAQQQGLVEKDEHVSRIAEDRNRLAQEVTELQAIVQTQQSHMQAIAQKEEEAARLSAERVAQLVTEQALLVEQVASCLATLRQREIDEKGVREACDQALREVDHLRLALSNEKAGIQELQRQTKAFQRTLEIEQMARNGLEFELSEVRTSLAWRLVSGYRRVKDRWFPSGTGRRKLYDGVLKRLKKASRITDLIGRKFGPVERCYLSWRLWFNVPKLLAVAKEKRLLIRKSFFYLRSFGLRRTSEKIADWADSQINLPFHDAAQPSSTEFEDINLPMPRLAQGSAVRPVDIIIPVYNQFAFVRRCIDSVFKHRCPSYNQIFVVDDASGEPELIEYLKSLEKIPNLRLMRNLDNLGFAKTTNLAMKYSSNDVLLLNSDTLVTKGWLTKIQQAAYIRDDVATVSPLSNNATICSIPKCCEANPIPAGFSVDSFAELLEGISLRIYPEVPTTVGFCMYIKRGALANVGYFNEEVFKEGYGEENDLCMRLTGQGYKHIIDDSTYVYHSGSASFPKEMQNALLSAGVDRVSRLHPTYLEIVENYLRENPLRSYYSFLRSCLHIRSTPKPVVLIVLHAPLESLGGVELQTGDLTRDLGDYFLAVMEGVGQKIKVQVFCEGARFLQLAFNLECRNGERDQEEIFSFLLRAFNIQVVHFQHLYGRPCSLPRIAKLSGAKTILSLHDFYLFCESYNLLNHRDEFCNYERDYLACSDCLHKKGLLDKWDPDYQRNRRAYMEKMMREDVDVIVTPSEFVKYQFSSLFPHVPAEKYRILENGA